MSAPDAEPRDDAAPDTVSRGYARSRERADAVRAGLQPLGPDERPLGIKLAVALALFIAAANLVAAAAGAGASRPRSASSSRS